MLRKNDPILHHVDRSFWEYAEKMDDGRMRCKFCGHVFAEGTSISRIKLHIAGVKHRGVRICGKVPQDVQEAALAAIDGPPEKKLETGAGSSNNEVTHPPKNLFCPGLGSYYDQLCSPSVKHDVIMDDVQSVVKEKTEPIASMLEQSNAILNKSPGDDGRIQVGLQSLEQGAEEELICLRPEAESGMENTCAEYIQHVDRNDSLAALGRNGSSSTPPGEDLASGLADQRLEGTAFLSDETRGDPFPTSSTMLVGRAFEENTRQIRSWIMDDKVSTIGIYGMAGLLQSQDIPHRLYWVPVPQNFSIERLQNHIAKRIGLDLSSEDDDLRRSIKLSKELLRQNQRWILFLDNLWDYFEPHVVGIPESNKGCKLIISTRSKEVSLKMASPSIIKVDTLSHEEAVSLFMMKHGQGIELSPEKKLIAKCIVNECGRLPLGIIAMAGSMKSLSYDRQWKNALQDLIQSRAGQSHMEMVFPSLKSSYTHLKKHDQKEGFLYCALFPKAFTIPKDDLIAYLIDEGVIAKQESRGAEFHRGHGLLDRLEDACLLESIDGGSAVKMHDLIRHMAIEIYDQERRPVMIKAEIPSRHSPRCPSLSTLLLPYNRELELIDDTFFNQLHGLKILDLSHTVIVKLPDSVSNLVGLTALLLIDCKKLVHVPSLEKLGKMRRLDLYRTALENIPQGLECLSELRYLRMSNCGQKKFPGWVLRKLSHLQVFILGWGKNAPMTVKGEEVGCLEKLEDLECHFKGHSDLVKFFNYRDQAHSLKTYKVRVGHLKEKNGKFSCLKEFYCSGCKSTKKLLPLVFLENLEVIEVSECEKMVEIIETESDEGRIDEESSRNSSTTKLELPKLKTLKLIELPELKSIFSATLICDSLEVIHIKNCEKLKRIPIFLPFLESNQSSPHPSLEIIIHPEERWESALEWDHPNAKDALRRFVKFQ
ncbi:disease resistance protein [Salix suchowensis]|nr:disease resistance protein [Salix suchowensis]